ncbi:hypothetical protein HBH43_064920 [Parastagonospora nodorum]|nr:hypothetical protein HBH43_064920 [Parastagonospora nodorum]
MVRNHGKFSFPMPGRKQKKPTRDDAASSTPSIPSAPEWPSRLDDSSSKAHRVLGTSEPMFRSKSKQSVPASPGYMSITVSEASYGSRHDDKRSAAEYDTHLTRPDTSRRPSSNVMGHAYSGEGRRGSDYSVASRRLHPQTSNSTMRSHYDAKSSPLSISQQTSDSAVRDMALRRGKPQVVVPDYNSNGYIVSPVSPVIQEEARRKDMRKSKPARLDLSKLFPKPRGGEGSNHSRALLSPAKMVNSPAALSITSEYQFPRPMTRDPTPNPQSQVKPKKLQRKQQSAPETPTSPVRMHKRDEYDNAKINVRRPPKGVQHWFDALDEDSDEATEGTEQSHAVGAGRPYDHAVHPYKASLDQVVSRGSTQQASRSHYLAPAGSRDTFSHEDLVDVTRLTSPSQYSLQSTKTKESALSKPNLQDSSVLSFSSSEDEGDNARATQRTVPVRKSLDMNDDSGEIVIGQAQAYEVRSQRRPSAPWSMRSSTSAATIEVMYTPEPPFTPLQYPRTSSYSGSKRSSHTRQPSVIHEDDDYRPWTAVNMSRSPPARSVRSTRTSTSEPRAGSDTTHKFMAVTAEEEALLELMRKKRAAMGLTPVPPANQGVQETDRRQLSPAGDSRGHPRTSGFLAEASPVRVVEHKATRKSSVPAPSPLQAPPRGRPLKAHYDASIGQSQLRDSSVASDAWSEQLRSPASRETLSHHLLTPAVFSPLDPFPQYSPILTASIISPATTEHASPLPSPITPGLRAYEEELNVKVANSDTSNDIDESSSGLDVLQDRAKSRSSSHEGSAHRRRRTASSGADVSFPVPPTHGLTDLAPVSEGSSRATSIIEPTLPRLQSKSSKRSSGLTLLTSGNSRNRQSSINSSHSQASCYSQTSSYITGAEQKSHPHRQITRQSSASSMSVTSTVKSKRSSVSDDVLAAWNSLGGTY